MSSVPQFLLIHYILLFLLAAFKTGAKESSQSRKGMVRNQSHHKTIKIFLRKPYFIDLDQGCNCFSACVVGFERTCK